MWRFTLTAKLLLALCLSVAGFVAVTSSAHAATFTVSKTADTNDGTCDADCSLREAVAAANAAGGADSIAFNIPGSDPNYNATTDEWTLTLASGLSITAGQNLTIDGSSQVGNGTFPTYGGKIILLNTTAFTVITLNGGVDFNLSRITFRSTNATVSSAIIGTSGVTSITNSYFTRDTPAGANNTVVAPTTTGNVVFSNNKVENYQRSFQTTNANAAATILIDSNVILSPTSIGLRPTGYNITTTNNTITGAASDQAIVVSCTGGTCITANNTITTPGGGFASIFLSGAGTHEARYNAISSNNNEAIGISSAGTIEYNTITGGSGNVNDGKISVFPNDITKPVVVRGNSIRTSNANPILVSGANTRAQVTRNSVTTEFLYTPLMIAGGTENAAKVTANDPGDEDTGANNLMNFPVITKVVKAGNTLIVTADLDFKGSEGPFIIEFFDNTALSPSGYGGGQYFIGSVVVTSPGNNRVLTVPITGQAPVSANITATATNVLNLTSEFSAGPADGKLHIADSSPSIYFDAQTTGGPDGNTRLFGTAVAAQSNITAVEFTVNGGSWQTAAAEDGNFGSPIERFYVDFKPSDNGNIKDGYVVKAHAKTSTNIWTSPAVFMTPFVITGPLDRTAFISKYPTFSFQVSSQTTELSTNLNHYQIQIRPTTPGASWDTYIDNIPINYTNVNNRSYESSDFLATYSPDFTQVSVVAKTKVLSGSYEWKVVAVDNANNGQSTATQTLYDGVSAVPGFPLAVLKISGSVLSPISTYNLEAVKQSYKTSTTTPNFYGIAYSGSQVTVTLTKQNCLLDCTKSYMTQTGGNSRFAIQVSPGVLATGGQYTTVLSALKDGQYTQLPSFTLQVAR